MAKNIEPRRENELAQPTNDIAFKKLFADPNHTFVLLDFLNAVLEPEYKMTIDKIMTVESVNLPDGRGGKLSAFDVRCVDDKGRQFVVEMQVLSSGWSKERAQWYAAKVYHAQLEKSQKYQNAQPVFLVAILDFNMFKNHDRYISYHTVRDTVDNQRYLDGFNFAFIELTKFKKETLEEAVSEKLTAWCLFFNKYSNDEIIKKLCEQYKAIEKAAEILKIFNWTPEERGVYDDFELIALDTKLAEEFAQKNNEEWIRKTEMALEESKKTLESKIKEVEESKKTIENKIKEVEESKKTIEAQAKELELSEEKVRLAEHKTKLELAQKLLKTGMPANEVAALTQLTQKVVENL